ncbi:MAG: LysM peptidoglycan-binding domain-containing protein [Bacteroidota bacterium]
MGAPIRAIFLSFIFLLQIVYAQVNEKDPDEIQPISALLDGLDKDYSFDNQVSSVYDTLILNTRNYRSNDVPVVRTNTIESRLDNIPAVISMDYNYTVKKFIDLYTVRRRDQVSRMLGLSKAYFPIFERELDAAGLPMELKYLPIVESALNPHARSRVGATGLWQFMYHTGKQYGLTVNSYVDERRDPLKSTIAATKYLQDAYDMFGDWLLAIASYNCGMGNVRKAIIRSGGKSNFWEIMSYLPRETRGYVPAFIAASYTFEYASDHNLYPVYVDFGLNTDTLHIRRMDITLSEIAEATNSSYEELVFLNPELKLKRIPYSEKPYVLNIPKPAAEYFVMHEPSLLRKYGKKRSQYASASPQVKAINAKYSTRYKEPSGKPKYYTVRSGDVVGTIAERFGVSARSIARWNNLRGYRIKVGQRLKIYGGKSAARKESTGKSVAVTGPVPSNGPAYHTVRKGETLWEISRQYPGVSVSNITALNPGMNPSKLDIGQRIRVK